jgi:hypothetical protein
MQVENTVLLIELPVKDGLIEVSTCKKCAMILIVNQSEREFHQRSFHELCQISKQTPLRSTSQASAYAARKPCVTPRVAQGAPQSTRLRQRSTPEVCAINSYSPSSRSSA